MKANSNQRQRRSIRLKDYDYTQAGVYFVTMRTRNKSCVLGKVVGGEMQLNRYGHIVNECWGQIPTHFPNVEIDGFVAMPNHIHGIVAFVDNCKGKACRAPTEMIERFGKPTACSLPTIVRSFKSAVTRRINALRQTQGVQVWQRNYYEHVIRNENDLNEIQQYILDNPVQWDMDQNNPDRQINEVKPRGELICQIR